MTYKKNGKWNPTFYDSKKRFEEMGYKVEQVERYNLKEHPEIKTNQEVDLNLKNKILPVLKKKQKKDKTNEPAI